MGVVVNNLGGTSNLEMGVVTNDAVRHLGTTLAFMTCGATDQLESFPSLQWMTAVWLW